MIALDISIIVRKAKEQRYTLASLERDAWLSNGSISKWPTNEPAFEKVLRVADCLCCSVDELIAREPKEDG